jgi:hypothetical protein
MNLFVRYFFFVIHFFFFTIQKLSRFLIIYIEKEIELKIFIKVKFTS